MTTQIAANGRLYRAHFDPRSIHAQQGLTYFIERKTDLLKLGPRRTLKRTRNFFADLSEASAGTFAAPNGRWLITCSANTLRPSPSSPLQPSLIQPLILSVSRTNTSLVSISTIASPVTRSLGSMAVIPAKMRRPHITPHPIGRKSFAPSICHCAHFSSGQILIIADELILLDILPNSWYPASRHSHKG